jgi:hypothetical protein
MALQTWLRKVIKIEKLRDSPEVLEFLERDKQNVDVISIEVCLYFYFCF